MSSLVCVEDFDNRGVWMEVGVRGILSLILFLKRGGEVNLGY